MVSLTSYYSCHVTAYLQHYQIGPQMMTSEFCINLSVELSTAEMFSMCPRALYCVPYKLLFSMCP